jgi:cobalt-zinc-cadmium efflux system protein
MGGGHSHGHAVPGAAYRGRLVAVIGLSILVLLGQVIGGLVSGSLALLADAGHVFADVGGLGLALAALHFAGRPASAEKTWGYVRLEVLAAVANAVLLLGVAGWVLVEAAGRLVAPPEVASGTMLAVALAGLVANAVALLVLSSGRKQSLNLRAAYLEVLADLLGSVAVVAAALVIRTTGLTAADPLASLVIGVLIVPRTWRLLREAVDVLLEATPRGMDLDEVRRHMEGLPAVQSVHDLHAWVLASDRPVLSAHVVVEEGALRDGQAGPLLDRLQSCLAGHFDVEHSTFQLEPSGHADHEAHVHP